MRQPLGVVAGIAPFNFPAMIVLWMLPIAIGTGNAFILKPSERVPGPLRSDDAFGCDSFQRGLGLVNVRLKLFKCDFGLVAKLIRTIVSPGAARIIAQLTAEAGLPKGVFSLLHGGLRRCPGAK